MHSIDFRIRCSDRCCEVLPDDTTLAECVVEELFYRVLSTFFDVVIIDEVSITFPPQDSTITLLLRAQGYDPFPLPALANLDCMIEDRLSCALVELFGSLHVESFAR
jgi:hypothetical protein